MQEVAGEGHGERLQADAPGASQRMEWGMPAGQTFTWSDSDAPAARRPSKDASNGTAAPRFTVTTWAGKCPSVRS